MPNGTEGATNALTAATSSASTSSSAGRPSPGCTLVQYAMWNPLLCIL